MAEFIKECDTKGYTPFISQARRCGKTAAFNLARQTQDVPHEIVTLKQITNE